MNHAGGLAIRTGFPFCFPFIDIIQVTHNKSAEINVLLQLLCSWSWWGWPAAVCYHCSPNLPVLSSTFFAFTTYASHLFVFSRHPASCPMGNGALSPGVKRPGCEAERLPPSGAEVNAWSYTPLPQYVFIAW